MAAARKWPFSKSSGRGVSGGGCLVELRKAGGMLSGVRGWKISGRRRKEKSFGRKGAVLPGGGRRGAPGVGESAGERGRGEVARGV